MKHQTNVPVSLCNYLFTSISMLTVAAVAMLQFVQWNILKLKANIQFTHHNVEEKADQMWRRSNMSQASMCAQSSRAGANAAVT